MRPAAYSSARTNGPGIQSEPVLGPPVAGQPEGDQGRCRVAHEQPEGAVEGGEVPAPAEVADDHRAGAARRRRPGAGPARRTRSRWPSGRTAPGCSMPWLPQPGHRRHRRGEDLVRGGGDAHRRQLLDDRPPRTGGGVGQVAVAGRPRGRASRRPRRRRAPARRPRRGRRRDPAGLRARLHHAVTTLLLRPRGAVGHRRGAPGGASRRVRRERNQALSAGHGFVPHTRRG